jgi:hypothetical protein
MSQGIDYRKILEYRDRFVREHGIRTEVRMNYMAGEEVRELNDRFELSYLEIEQRYDGMFVIMMRAEIDCVVNRIEQLEEKLDNVLKEIESLKKEKAAAIEIY